MNNFLSRGLVAAAAFAALSLASTGLHAEDVPEAAEVAPASEVAPSVELSPAVNETRPLSVTVELNGGTKLTGSLTNIDELVLNTSFGGTNIPLSEVAGVRFAPANSASTTVVMLNGDSITGATEVELMTIETQWGVAEIEGSNIASVMFVAGLAWQSQVGLTGDRWNLTTAKKPVAPQTSNAKKSNASSSNRRPNTSSGRTSFFSRSR